jgi:allophanate hydrolase subunit 1
MFDAGRERPSLLAAGDRVRFVPIDLATFNSQWRGLPGHE